ncbi:uncharacterized protein CLUP02_09438 [Colletotrichum lupini]|uniref:Uncharacterized protein n=1 Tax=Colletotrichum lupini TaxID=145971 RepID=A0A9Q8SWK3_9PEZI|nr:uncharacterized protein CLUP02_09438 [Colletotrichum lupini]UQC83942.1 hypothetical protein CLUP02_09438 [Colletotrichum lupini]
MFVRLINYTTKLVRKGFCHIENNIKLLPQFVSLGSWKIAHSLNYFGTENTVPVVGADSRTDVSSTASPISEVTTRSNGSGKRQV